MMEANPVVQASVPSSQRKCRRRKTFTGCWDCRSRKVKCDEAIPECNPCRRRGFLCSGYQPLFIWVAPNQKKYEPGRRRFLKSYLTWQGQQTYDSFEVDELIAKCDESSPDHTCFSVSAGPFTVFPIHSFAPSPQAPLFDASGLLDDRYDRRLRNNAGFLFHHYSTYIAPNMMPFEDARNPWQSFYPLMARRSKSRGQQALLHAMLAQASGNLANLGSNKELMSSLTVEHYVLAVEDLRNVLEDSSKDFSMVLAVVLTLIMAEVYNGQFKAWRLHMKGAWDFIRSHQKDQPWHQSDEAWLTAQSLCLLRIRCDTMKKPEKVFSEPPNLDSMKWLMLSVSSRVDFGFTVGANLILMACIIETTELASRVSQHGPDAFLEAISNLYHRLRTCSSSLTSQAKDVAQLHHQIFQLGAIIYFHRSIFSSKPRALKSYLDQILQHLKKYRELGGGYVTLWPVFIAAVEAYAEHHQAGFRKWLNDCDRLGAGSRKDIRVAIEAVWEKRTCFQRLDVGLQLGEIVVDWREVMSEMGLDILLV